MSGIVEFFKCVYVRELAGIDTGEKCLGDHKNPWAVGCAYGVTLGQSVAGFLKAAKTGDCQKDPCVAFCGIWQKVKKIIGELSNEPRPPLGKFKVKGKFEYHTSTCVPAR